MTEVSPCKIAQSVGQPSWRSAHQSSLGSESCVKDSSASVSSDDHSHSNFSGKKRKECEIGGGAGADARDHS